MYKIRRKSGEVRGDFIVYEGRREAIDNGISPDIIFDRAKKIREVGDWYEYCNGLICEVLKIYQLADSRTILTAMNMFNDLAVNPDPRFRPYGFRVRPLDLVHIDAKKTRFVEDWLFRGFGISESIQRNMIREFWIYSGKRGKNRYQMLKFGCWILNYPWFDELLRINRPVRDRYMSITKTFEKEGISDAYLAQKLKLNIESTDGKVSNAALFKAIDLVEAAQNKNRKRPDEVPEELKIGGIPARVEGGYTDQGLKEIEAKKTAYLDEVEHELYAIQKINPQENERVMHEIFKKQEGSPIREAEYVSNSGNGQGSSGRASSPERERAVFDGTGRETGLSGSGQGKDTESKIENG